MQGACGPLARMLEQSLIKTCKPYYNQDDTVNFVVTSWNSNCYIVQELQIF